VTALRSAAVAAERSSLALVDGEGGFSRHRSLAGFMTCRRIPLSARTRALIDTDKDKPSDRRNKVGASFVESDNSLAVDRTDRTPRTASVHMRTDNGLGLHRNRATFIFCPFWTGTVPPPRVTVPGPRGGEATG
jgi:hypothetical protein